MNLFAVIDAIAAGALPEKAALSALIAGQNPELAAYAAEKASALRDEIYGRRVFLRGLIEFTNICRCDCYYCGIRRSNEAAERYRLTEAEILSAVTHGKELGFHTFVLQGGEDGHFSDAVLAGLIQRIKAIAPEAAVTLSVGERSPESYRILRKAGADRYLLRHETADPEHYAMLHPKKQTSEARKRCLWELKAAGYQVGSGFMVGSPGQTPAHLAEDLAFLYELKPQMVGIGPFVPHKDTPLGGHPAGSADQTIFLLSLVRLMLPRVLLPATTALGTILPDGRERAVQAGANVVMPNLSPVSVRQKYSLYDNKLCTGDETAEAVQALRSRFAAIGYTVDLSRGDAL